MNRINKDNIINIINDNQKKVFEVDHDLKINCFNENTKDFEMDIIQNNNSNVVLNITIINNYDSLVLINTIIKGNNNKLIINLRAVSENNRIIIKVNSSALDNTKNNIIVQNLRGINENGTVQIDPILRINTKEIEASHNAIIGSYNEEELNYLKALAISEENAKKLLKKGFIYSIFDEDFLKLLEERR